MSSSPIPWEINGNSEVPEFHSVLNECSQEDQQEAIIFIEWYSPESEPIRRRKMSPCFLKVARLILKEQTPYYKDKTNL